MRNKTVSKLEIKEFVRETIIAKIEKLNNFLNFTLEASREIKKTPKYDSMREEMQEEIYQMQRQLGALTTLKQKIGKVVTSPSERVTLGSVVFTNKARFYISVSLGEFFYEGDRFYAISEESPMAKIMFGKKPGDSFALNNISQTIESIM